MSTLRFPPRPDALRRRFAAAALPAILALSLGACSSTTRVANEPTGAIAAPVTAADFQKSADYWAGRYEKAPKDRTVALSYAAALTRLGRSAQAVAVLEKAAIAHPKDREVLAAYGKSLAATGELPRALEIVQRAQTPDRPDWKLISAEAAILDQLGQHAEARRLYAQALIYAPNEPSILSNYGMSYVLSGDLAEGERLLRQAAALPNADSRVKQNLALAVGLSGRYAEAEKIASAELPPDEAAENVAYLKSMMAQKNDWQTLASADAALPTN